MDNFDLYKRCLELAEEDLEMATIAYNNNKFLFSALTPYYVKARYPSYKENDQKSLSKTIILKYIETTKEFFSWLKHRRIKHHN